MPKFIGTPVNMLGMMPRSKETPKGKAPKMHDSADKLAKAKALRAK